MFCTVSIGFEGKTPVDCMVHAPSRHADRLVTAFLKLGYWMTAEEVPIPVMQAMVCARLIPL